MKNRQAVKAKQVRLQRARDRAPSGVVEFQGKSCDWSELGGQLVAWRRAVEDLEPGVVVAAREDGASWADIARAVGQTEQQLRRRYG